MYILSVNQKLSEIVASGDGLTRVRILDIEIMEKGDN
jgi:hypothetical protein